MAGINCYQSRLWGHQNPLLAQGSFKTALCSSNLISYWGNSWAPLCNVCCQQMLLQARVLGMKEYLITFCQDTLTRRDCLGNFSSSSYTRISWGKAECHGNTSSFGANLQTQAANPDVMLKALHVWQVRLYYKQSLWELLKFTSRVLWSHSSVGKKKSPPLYYNTQNPLSAQEQILTYAVSSRCLPFYKQIHLQWL